MDSLPQSEFPKKASGRGGARQGAGRKPKLNHPLEKWCPACRTILPGAAFGISRSTRTGLQCYCRKCTNLRRRLRYDRAAPTQRDRFNALRSQALQRSRRFLLSLEEFCDLQSKPCAYGDGQEPHIRIGLDRKDNRIGYTAQNCVPCCARHNKIKSDIFSYTEMLKLVRLFSSAAKCGNARAGRKKLSRERRLSEFAVMRSRPRDLNSRRGGRRPGAGRPRKVQQYEVKVQNT